MQSLVDPKSATTDKIFVDSRKISTDESVVKYIYLLLKTKDEIKEKTFKAKKPQEKLKVMEKYLLEIKDVKYKVFVMRHINRIKVRDIAWKLNYAEFYR